MNHISNPENSEEAGIISAVASDTTSLPILDCHIANDGVPSHTNRDPNHSLHESQNQSEANVSETPYLLQWVGQLATLNVRLLQHSYHIPKANTDSGLTGNPMEEQKAFCIDKTFHLSQEFINIMSSICERLPRTPRHLSPLLGIDKGDESDCTSLDASSELLVFSTYLRLIEVYEMVLHRLQAYVTHRGCVAATEFPFSMPGLNIGSFSLSSEPDTQSLILLHLVESMLTRARGLVANMVSPQDTPGYRGSFECFGGVTLVIVPDLALQALHAKERVTFRLIESIKGLVEHSRQI